eukprot:PhM_4_TR13694/c0_g1_i2/m.22944
MMLHRVVSSDSEEYMGGTAATFDLGERVSDIEGYLGYVRYVGPFSGQTRHDMMIGVEWDNPIRGKHKGTYKGTHYFSLADHRHTASFIAPQSLYKGVCFSDAVRRRYSSVGDVTKYRMSGPIPFQQADDGSFPFLTNCACAGVPQLKRIARCGPPGTIRALFPNIVDLNLSECMITSWREILNICQELDKLEFLAVGSNPLGDLDRDAWRDDDGDGALQEDVPAFPSVLVLKASKTGCSGKLVADAMCVFPNLKEVALCENEETVKCVPTLPPHLIEGSQLECVRLNKTGISSWGDVEALGVLPKLKALHLSDTKLSEVRRPTPDAPFGALQQLYLRKTQLSSWVSFDNINAFPEMIEVAATDVPVLSTELNAAHCGDLTEKQRRDVLVAQMPKIKCLNGGAVTDHERFNAERTLLRHFFELQEDPTIPPCYHALQKKHGELKPLVHVDLSPTLEVEVTMKLVQASSKSSRQHVPFLVEELPEVLSTSMTVDTRWLPQQLVEAAEKEMGGTRLKRSTLQIFFFDSELAELPGPRKHRYHVRNVPLSSSRKLFDLKVKDGDTFYFYE